MARGREGGPAPILETQRFPQLGEVIQQDTFHIVYHNHHLPPRRIPARTRSGRVTRQKKAAAVAAAAREDPTALAPLEHLDVMDIHVPWGTRLPHLKLWSTGSSDSGSDTLTDECSAKKVTHRFAPTRPVMSTRRRAHRPMPQIPRKRRGCEVIITNRLYRGGGRIRTYLPDPMSRRAESTRGQKRRAHGPPVAHNGQEISLS